MQRNFFTFLSIFLFAVILAKAQQSEPVIEMVSVDTATQKITITWQYLNGIDTITIFKCTDNCNSEENITDVDKVIQSELMWQDITADQSIPNYYCIGWKKSGKSPPHCSMVLKATPSEDGCNNAVLLTWNPYINMPDSIDYYKILYRKANIDTAFMLLDTLKGTHIAGFYFNPANKLRYHARFLESNTIYEFLIQAVNKTNTLFPFSNIAIYTTKSVADTLVPVTIDKISVIDDSYIQIDVITNNFQDPFEKLYLLRDKPNEKPLTPDLLSFHVIDSAAYDLNNQYRFTDFDAKPSAGLYYYLAIAENKCKANDTSNILTNIYLHGRRVEKYNDSIFFSQWGFNAFTPAEPYELFRIVNDKPYTITNDLTLKNCNYYVDVFPFMDDGTMPKYQIRSSNDCFSNTLSIGHEPVISFPNAFYPQSTRKENKTFYPIIKFPSEDNYLFLIYNRWGQEVYRATLPPPVYDDFENPVGRWDGTFKGKDCPAGIYAFRISFSYNEGSGKYSESGSFMLVR